MNTKTFLLALSLLAGATGLVSAQSFIDFEFVPGDTPSEGLLITNQFQASLGVTFMLEDGSPPRLAEVGAPRTAFSGFGGSDMPAPGVDVGQFFLTDDGSVGAAPPALLVTYDNPVGAASAEIIDIDFSEEWTVEAKDVMGNVIGTQILGANGNGSATPFNFSFPTAAIKQIRIEFTGSGNGIGLAFDNFLTASPGQGVGQGNTTVARLEINGQGQTGSGPFDVSLPVGNPLIFDWMGPPGQAVALIAANINPGAAIVPCLGSIDLGTPPLFGDVLVVFDGSAFPDSLIATLGPTGLLTQTSTVPASASGLVFGVQGLVFQPSGSPCNIVATAAFELTIF